MQTPRMEKTTKPAAQQKNKDQSSPPLKNQQLPEAPEIKKQTSSPKNIEKLAAQAKGGSPNSSEERKVEEQTSAMDSLASKRYRSAAAVPKLLDAIKNKEPSVANWAAWTLGRIGSYQSKVIDALHQALTKHSDPLVQAESALALGQLGASRKDVIETLVKTAAAHSDWRTRHAAAESLGLLGTPAKAALDALRGIAADDPSLHVRRAAKRSIELIKAPAKDAGRWAKRIAEPTLTKEQQESLDTFRKTLKTGTTEERLAVMPKLSDMRHLASTAIPELKALLTHERAGIRNWSAWILGRMGPDAAAAAPALGTVLTKDADPNIRAEAAVALGEIGPQAAGQLKALRSALRDADYRVQLAAVEALGMIGQAKGNPPDEMLQMLNSREPAMRQAAAAAIGRIGAEIPDKLKERLAQMAEREPDTRVKRAVKESLARLSSS